MKIKEIRYKRVKNLGNYESETLELLAELNDNNNLMEAIDQLKEDAREALDIPDPESEIAF